MKTRSSITLVLATVTLALMGTVPNIAEAQNRVSRLLLMPMSVDSDCAALEDLVTQDSHALIARDLTDDLPISFASYEFYKFDQREDAVLQTLASNFGTSQDDPFVVALAAITWDHLSRAGFRPQEAIHVRNGGPETIALYFDQQGAPKGSVALTGPAGDVLPLGEFMIYKIDTTNSPWCGITGDCGKWAVTSDPDQAHATVCLALGSFTR